MLALIADMAWGCKIDWHRTPLGVVTSFNLVMWVDDTRFHTGFHTHWWSLSRFDWTSAHNFNKESIEEPAMDSFVLIVGIEETVVALVATRSKKQWFDWFDRWSTYQSIYLIDPSYNYLLMHLFDCSLIKANQLSCNRDWCINCASY